MKCIFCNKVFKIKNPRHIPLQRYCSERCQDKARYQREKLKLKGIAKLTSFDFDSSFIKRYCVVCGKSIAEMDYQERGNYCIKCNIKANKYENTYYGK